MHLIGECLSENHFWTWLRPMLPWITHSLWSLKNNPVMTSGKWLVRCSMESDISLSCHLSMGQGYPKIFCQCHAKWCSQGDWASAFELHTEAAYSTPESFASPKAILEAYLSGHILILKRDVCLFKQPLGYMCSQNSPGGPTNVNAVTYFAEV